MDYDGCFNPRIRKGCDAAILNNRRFELVSIHASVKDATDIKTTLNDLFVSFNPRIRKGCDSTFNSGGTLRPVSIHASVKDATLAGNGSRPSSSFQSTHP